MYSNIFSKLGFVTFYMGIGVPIGIYSGYKHHIKDCDLDVSIDDKLKKNIATVGITLSGPFIWPILLTVVK